MIKQMTKMIKNDENDNTNDKTYNKNDKNDHTNDKNY